jgi:exonuclease-1
MGIAGLLPLLKEAFVEVNLANAECGFEGKRVAVDANGVLHKAIYSCAVELETGKQTDKY